MGWSEHSAGHWRLSIVPAAAMDLSHRVPASGIDTTDPGHGMKADGSACSGLSGIGTVPSLLHVRQHFAGQHLQR
jgi:hypothetical protein